MKGLQVLQKYNKGIKEFNWCCALIIIDIYSKYSCPVPLKDKEGITITRYFSKKVEWFYA